MDKKKISTWTTEILKIKKRRKRDSGTPRKVPTTGIKEEKKWDKLIFWKDSN